jgi:shikimate kinase
MMNAGRRVYIIGFMGSGKSTAGRKLAAALGWHFIDLDKEIELKEGKSIKDIFSGRGETYFRKLESETLKSLMLSCDSVISAGGGTPCWGVNMEFMLRTGTVVYLKMTPGELKSRLEGGAAKRPLIREIRPTELLKYITGKLAEREEYYLRAQIIVDGIDFNIKMLADRINSAYF